MPAPRYYRSQEALVFRALGPLEVSGPEGPVLITQQVRRRALAALLLRPGVLFPRDRLAAALWDTHLPDDGGRDALRTTIYGLRKDLGPALATRIQTVQGGPKPGGWLVKPGENDTDVLVFRGLVSAGRGAWYRGQTQRAADSLAKAVRLWRGEMADLPPTPAVRPEANRLRSELRDAQDLEADARLALGQYQDVAADLSARAASGPLREHSWAQLMRALYLCGAPDAALRVFATARKAMAAENGSGPGPELMQMRQQVLARVHAQAAAFPPPALATA